ncbi:MAG: DeoR/GlpR transcriptional regulator [Rubrivivax sp.]|nr:DeoR/GlpR transcriptional regulator [Rubrivivax sp.]
MLSTEELASHLGVSAETVRRDLVRLEGRGLIRRVHGGASSVLGTRGTEATFSERASAGTEAKTTIGALAASLVKPGQTIVFDVGTTALAVARALPPDYHGTVVTCSLLVACELAGRTGVEVLVCGGRVRAGDLAVSNAQAVAFMREVHADVSFLGSGGISAEVGVTDYHLDEVATRRVLITNSQRPYVLADAEKFGRVSAHRVCGFAEVAGVITDREPPPALLHAITRVGAQVLFPR